MFIADYLKLALNSPKLNANNVCQIESVYNVKLVGEARNLAACLGASIYFSDTTARVLSFDEVVNDCVYGNVSFRKYNVVPFLALSDTMVIVYAPKDKIWGIFNVYDRKIYKYNKHIVNLITTH